MSEKLNLDLNVDIAVHDEDQLVAVRKEMHRLAQEITAVASALKGVTGGGASFAKAASGAKKAASEAMAGEENTLAALKRRWSFQSRMNRQRDGERAKEARAARQEAAEAERRFRDSLSFATRMASARERSARQEASAVAKAAKEEARAKASSIREATRIAERAAKDRARAEADAERQVRNEIRETARIRAREQRDAERRQREHDRNLERAARGAGRVRDGAGRVGAYGAAATAVMGYGTATAIRRGVSTRYEIDRAETALKTFNDVDDGKGGRRALNGADIKKLRRGKTGLDAEAIKNGVSISQALEVYNEAAKAGLMDPMEQSRTIMKAGAALELDPKSITQLFGTMGRNMGKDATPARLKSVANAIAVAAREDPTQANDIVEGMKRGQGLLAMSSGITEEDLAGFVSGGISAGIQPGKAGTWISSLGKSITEGGSKFIDPKKRKELNFAARHLGFGSAKNMASEFAGKNGKNVLYQVLQGLKDMAPQLRAQVADALSGGQWSDEDLQAVNGLEGMKSTDAAIHDRKNSGFLDTAAATKMSSWEGMWNQSKTIFSLFWESFGSGFDGILRDINAFFLDLHSRFNYDQVSEYVRDAIDGLRTGLGFSSWKEALQSIFPSDISGMGPQIRQFFQGFGEGLRSIGSVIRSVASFFSGGDGAANMGALAGKLLALSVAAIALGPVIGVIGGVVTMVAGLAGVARGLAGAGAAGAGGALAGAGVWASIGGVIGLGFLAKVAGSLNILKSDDKKGLFGNLVEELIPAPLRRYLDTGTFSTTPPEKVAPWVDPPARGKASPAEEVKSEVQRQTRVIEEQLRVQREALQLEKTTALSEKAKQSSAAEIPAEIRSAARQALSGSVGASSEGAPGAGGPLSTGMGRNGIIGRSGGSRSWRNSNPGNLRDGPFARRMGATGADAAGFAIFPDEATGRKAQEALLFGSDSYKNLSIRDAIKRYAPGSDGNDPNGYANFLARKAGVGVETRLSDLNPEQRRLFLDAQREREGWSAGSSGGVSSPGGNPVDVAKQFEGMGERNSGRSTLERFVNHNIAGSANAWCARFVNASLAAVNQNGTGSAVANSFLRWGKAVSAEMVQKGDVLVDHRGRGPGATGGHVGMATGKTRTGRNGELELEMIAGNSSDRVQTTWERASKLAVRRSLQAQEAVTASQDLAAKAQAGTTDIGDGMRSSGWKKSSTGTIGGAPMGTTTPIKPSAVPSANVGGGGNNSKVDIHVNGAHHTPEELANTVQRKLQESMNRRTHDYDGFA